MQAHHPGQSLEYLFIAYTQEQFPHTSKSDMDALHAIAKRATRDAGFSAYWVGCACMPDDNEPDIYRICDVIRGAHALIIAIGPNGNVNTHEQMLQQWGSRMWTYPEVLLSPGDTIKVSNDVC